MKTVDCEVVKAHIMSRKFKVRTPQYFANGDLVFPRYSEREDGSYKTVFGPVCWHPGVVYARNNKNMSMALRRQTGIRNPSTPGYHMRLENNQDRFIRVNRTVHQIFQTLRNRVVDSAHKVTDFVDMAIVYVEESKSKKRLRREALAEILANADFYNSIFSRIAEGKVKSEEIGKPGKYARLFVNLGVTSSFSAGPVVGWLKDMFNGAHKAEFIPSPERSVLARVFSELMDPHPYCFKYFSDDSCVSVRCRNGVFMANVDIVSCDSSHTKAVFNVLRKLVDKTAYAPYVEKAIKQCELPLKIFSYTFRRMMALLIPRSPVLYSGSVLTTLINNIANLLISVAIEERLRPLDHLGCSYTIPVEDMPQLIMDAAADVGYQVTVDVCSSYHDLQFLKHSPVFDVDGVLRAITNIGVILRLLGSCYGDLPGTRKIGLERRAFIWNCEVIRSLVHFGEHTLLKSLQRTFTLDTRQGEAQTVEQARVRVAKLLEYKVVEGGDPHTIDDSEVTKRYGLSSGDWEEMLHYFHEAGNGHGFVIECLATRRILQKDYGL